MKKKSKLTKRKNEQPAGSDTEVSQGSQSSQISIVEKMAEEVSDDGMARAFRLKTKKRRITDEGDSTFTHPTTKTASLTKQTSTLSITNKFEKAGKIVTQPDMHTTPRLTNEAENETETKTKTKRPPPPIVIHGQFLDHKTLNTYLTAKLKEKFYWKHTANTTILQTTTYEDWVLANKNFDTGKIEFHTYTPREEKSHAFVLRGLYHEVDVEEIKDELKTHDVLAKEIYIMKGTKFPSFMVVTTSATTLKNLEQNVKFLDHTVVRWERHNNNKKIIQCHRCQMWGHATSNCRASPRCLKCAMEHLTNQCTKSREEPAKCVNCAEAHPANSVACPVYQDKIWQLEKRNTRVPPPPETRYMAAPPPATNAWTHRQQQMQSQQQP